MPGFGGFAPFPRRCGGGATRLQALYESLNASMGTAYDTSPDSFVSAETMANARVLDSAWSSPQRLANQFVPEKMTSFLERWEGILKTIVRDTDSEADRRAKIKDKQTAFGKAANRANVESKIRACLGEIFVAVEFIPLQYATIHAPSGYDVGTPSETAPWYSTVGHVLVLVERPYGMTEGQFYERASRLHECLDPIVSSWTTYDWYRSPFGQTAYAIPNGPSQTGFYLDTPRNLDNNVFTSLPVPGQQGFYLDVPNLNFHQFT